MLNSFRKLLGQNLGGPARSLLFFIFFYLYLWLGVDLHLIYHGGGVLTNFPPFYKDWAFFREFVTYPGGLVEYASAFLSQFLYYSWAGAIVITLQAWMIFICTGCFFKAINARRLCWLRFVPPLLLLITYSQYTYYFLTTMALSAALFCVCLYLRTPSKNKSFLIVIFLILSVILYTIAGGAYLLFATLCVTYELILRRQQNLGLLYLLSTVVIPYVLGVLLFGVSIINAFGNLLPLSWKVLSYKSPEEIIVVVCILYLLVPLVTVGLGFWWIFAGSHSAPLEQVGKSETTPVLTKSGKKGGKKHGAGIFSWYRNSPILRWTVESMVLFAIAGSVFFWHNNERRTSFAVDYYACKRMWPEVIDSARRYSNSYFIVHSVNRALYHTDRLNYDMLVYPQHPGTLFLPIKEHASVSWKRFDTYIDLGLINKAEHDLMESLEKFGERPTILKRLALINMVKGNFNIARTYLGVLGKTLFETHWANNYLDKLEEDPDLSTDTRIQHLRSLMPKQNYHFALLDDEQMLLDLLTSNRQNRMAFEYLMARYLLSGELEKFAKNLKRLDDFSYFRSPLLYEEAILYLLSNNIPVDLHGRQISIDARQRLTDFLDIYNRNGRNKQEALNELRKNYGDSYLFYSLYGFSGAKR
ncbi:MAG: DUF6057 family protein [Planctomycetota bacterium]|jgi:hypothetical protein